jgi:4'-phosphopantetheinyl transferase
MAVTAVPDPRLAPLPSPVDGVYLWAATIDRGADDLMRSALGDADRAWLATVSPWQAWHLIARRTLMRAAVATVAGCAEQAVDELAGTGPRRMRAGSTALLYVSSSYSGRSSGLFAVASVPVGVDLELLPGPPDALLVSQELLPDAESAWILRGGVDLADRFLHTWVRKEAVVKCTGEGLSRNLRSFLVDPARPAAPVRAPDGTPLGIWTYGIDMDGQPAALAVSQRDRAGGRLSPPGQCG